MVQNIVSYSNKREREAREILKKIDLESQIKDLGRLKLIGSINHHTMIKPDIDLVVFTKDKKDIGKIVSILKKIFKEDKRFCGEQIKSRKQLSGKMIHVFYKADILWKFDILVTINNFWKDLEFENKLKEVVKGSKRKTILDLKYYFYKNNLSRASLSMDIYTAVVKDNVKNIEDFFRYLDKQGTIKKNFKYKSWYKT